MEIYLAKAVSFIIGCLLLWVHLIPFLMSLDIIKHLKKNNKEYSPYIILLIVSLIPSLIYLFLLYFGLTCGGGGCFNGMFFFMSLIPAVILSIINKFFKNYIYKTYRIQSTNNNEVLQKEYKKENQIIKKKINPLVVFLLFCVVTILLFKLIT